MHAGDAEHGVVDAVAFEAAVAEDLPGLHAGEDVLDAGADLLVGLVVFLFPVREFGLAVRAAVRDDESGARVAAVGDREWSCRRRPWRRIPPMPCSRCGCPASGRPTTTTRRVSASMTTWWLVEYR